MFVIAVWNLDRFLPSFTEVKDTEHRTMYQCVAVGALREGKMNYLGRNIIHYVERQPRLRGYHYLSRTCLGGGARPSQLWVGADQKCQSSGFFHPF